MGKAEVLLVHAMKAYRGAEVKLHSFLNSKIGGGRRLTLSHYRFCPQRNNSGSKYTGGWVGPKTGLDIMMKKNLEHTGIRTQSVPPVTSSLHSIRYVQVLYTIVFILFRNLSSSDCCRCKFKRVMTTCRLV